MSFVLRSGLQPLKKVTITWSDLVHTQTGDKIPASLIDVRIVKCWFQAGKSLDRRTGDPKILVPELLLHDSNLVQVDLLRQVNIIRDYNKITDSPSLLPFEVPPTFNQQLWITVHVPSSTSPGTYQGSLNIALEVDGASYQQALPMQLNVLSESLNDPPFPISLYYLGNYVQGYNGISCRSKSKDQLLSEMKDMRAHGLTNIGLCHYYSSDSSLTSLSVSLENFRQAGFLRKELLYIDWQMTDSSDMVLYNKKLTAIKELSGKYNFTDVYIYNKDESDYQTYMSLQSTFIEAKKLGLKNFVATKRVTALQLKDLLDVGIIPRCQLQERFGDPSALTLNSQLEEQNLEPYWCNPWSISDPVYFTIQSGKGVKKPGAYVTVSQYFPSEAGKTYRLSYEILDYVKGYIVIAQGGGGCTTKDYNLPVTKGTHSVDFQCDITGGTLRLGFGTDTDLIIDNISVQNTDNQSSQKEFWAYNTPQAGQETPGTYYVQYGPGLIKSGFKGILNFAYQTGYPWDDWAEANWRPHVMAYPTLKDPIPTLQWEGFREAIDAIKIYYLTQQTPTPSPTPTPTPPEPPRGLKVQ
ncbi:MAG: hypothetical protein WHS86_11375 [Desulfosoma sp.]